MNKIKILGSGSSGNCYSLNVDNEILLLDLGFNYKKILEFVNYELDKVVGALVTHEHKDHSKAVEEIANNGIDVYATQGTFESLDIQNHRTNIIKANKPCLIGNFTILPFMVEHDAVEPVGFLVKHKSIGSLLYITDTYYVKYKFNKINHILVECNYSKQIIDETLKDKMFLRNRIVESHFELNNVIDFLKASDLSVLKTLTLIHLSSSNSDEKLFKSEVEKAIGHPVEIAKKDLEIYL
ncbi:MBL fold metallo-hydrolase [Peptostreptococcus faecalis]|uniref:MBL fold metallo-hydrolase n=1 Tax=Peptostreptococcus faecalis TaxID=2045015 RepID=UPI000C7CBDC0|nr:MBL fold metallo-hydrolase [Peptostreptococcus faecalis]